MKPRSICAHCQREFPFTMHEDVFCSRACARAYYVCVEFLTAHPRAIERNDKNLLARHEARLLIAAIEDYYDKTDETT